MENKTYVPIRYETVAQFIKRAQISRRKFDDLKAEGIIPVVQTSARMIRIDPKQADRALLAYQTGGISNPDSNMKKSELWYR